LIYIKARQKFRKTWHFTKDAAIAAPPTFLKVFCKAFAAQPMVSPLERDDFSSNRHLALAYWWSMIFSENRYPPFGIML
jgi:hypothetical protein